MNFKDFLEKLQNLSDRNKKIVLWTTVAVLAIIMGIFWINETINSVEKITKETGHMQFPSISQTTTPSNNPATQPTKSASADWKTYTNTEDKFEIEYPLDWRLASVNMNNVWDAVAFCPAADKSCSGLNQVYLVLYKDNPSTVNSDSHYLGTQNGLYYYLDSFPQADESMVEQMISTFKFINK